ncbi:MAG: ABC transporter ATP-binding protein [Gammaproteobacteria bacterium]|nr:ABC transporter ATP-binding protein [Gammaproteobacteria bacterium]
MSQNAYIKLKDFSIDFPIYTAERSLKRALMSSATGGIFHNEVPSRPTLRALDSINLDINEGDRIGLYGHNGSGKTTLLRALAGAYAPTSGSITVKGRVASLLDISMGMEGDASGWENIILRGLTMGMSPKEIKSKMNEIADFSELGGFLDMPLRTYSSGMQVRLAFAVSTAVDAEIILLDEWLSVGDESFQEKAESRLKEMVIKTPIMILASHSKNLLDEVTTKTLHMEHGKLKDQ